MRLVLFLGSLAAFALPATLAIAETAAEKAIAQQIGRQLKDSGQLRDYRIGVKYQDGVVWLNGTVANANQRNAAIQLTEQMEGVAHVVCQLQYPGGMEPARSQRSPNPFPAADEAQPTNYRNAPSPVVHAIANNGAAQQAYPPMVAARPNSQPRGFNAATAKRNNMPLPSRQSNGSMGMGQGVRQASAQGVYHAGGAAAPSAMTPGAMGSGYAGAAGGDGMQAVPVGFVPHGSGRGPSYENAQMPGYAWPSYASYPNYAALTYPKQYSPTAWPYIGPFYPYPQVPLAWRKVSLEWDDGWWFLDFSAHNSTH